MRSKHRPTSSAPLAAALAAAALLPAGASAQNLILNAGFENGVGEVNEWPVFASGGGLLATTETSLVTPRTGTRALALGQAPGVNQFTGVFQTVSVTPGQTVTWGIHAKANPGFLDRLEYRVEFADAGDNLVAPQFAFNVDITDALTNDYQLFTNSEVVPAGAARATLVLAINSFDGGGQGGVVAVDDVFLEVEGDDGSPPPITPGTSGPPLPANYALVWSDEFDGNTGSPDPATGVDLDNWEFQLGNGCPELCTWGNGEAQFYTDQPSNIKVEDGALRITARRNGNSFTSGRVRSIDRVQVTYGQIEVRMRVPKTPGIWPAAWMLFDPVSGQNPNAAGFGPYGGWAASGEIDIFESRDADNVVHGTIHYGSEFPGNTSRGRTINPGTDISQTWNTYTIRWTPDELRWYFNGTEYHTLNRNAWFSNPAQSAPLEFNPRAPFDQPFYFLLNVAVDGFFPQQSAFDGAFPQELAIDYIRVYQLQQTPFGGTAPTLPALLEAEEFDIGYPNEAFADFSIDNTLSGARPDADVEIANIPGGQAVSTNETGEWTEYTVDVPVTGTYYVGLSATTAPAGGEVSVSVEGDSPVTVDLSSELATERRPAIQLDAGTRVIRVRNATPSGAPLIQIDSIALMCNPADLVAPYLSIDTADTLELLEQIRRDGIIQGLPGTEIADLDQNGDLDFFDVIRFTELSGQPCP